jgi:hypothetical protein
VTGVLRAALFVCGANDAPVMGSNVSERLAMLVKPVDVHGYSCTPSGNLDLVG